MMQCNRWKVQLTLAAHQRGVLRVGEAEVQGQLALGGVDVVRVGKADLHLQVVLCFVAETVLRVLPPGPGGRVLYRVGGVLGLELHQHRAALHSAQQNTQRHLETSDSQPAGHNGCIDMTY